MKKRELKALRRDELLPRLQEVRKELMKLNAQVAVGTMLKDPGHLRVLKRSVAKMLTKRRQMEGREAEGKETEWKQTERKRTEKKISGKKQTEKRMKKQTEDQKRHD